jgi:hypothetical protein
MPDMRDPVDYPPDEGGFEHAMLVGDQASRTLVEAGWEVVGGWDGGEEPAAVALRHPDHRGVFITVSGHQDSVSGGWIS